MDFVGGLSAEMFYGAKTAAQERIEAILRDSEDSDSRKVLPRFMKQLLGPSRTWNVFKKQQDAIDSCLQRRNGLMCFAFEESGGRRSFLVAHPKVFWAVNSHRFFRDCSTYEIIQEHAVCKLYLDVEFEYECNAEKNGDRMLQNFLGIINHNLKMDYGVPCATSDVLDLDSSSNKKYSHHIIYQIPSVAFQDNYSVGNFVRKICRELKSAVEKCLYGCKADIMQLVAKYDVTEAEILEFFVSDSKGKMKLFIDEGVYTKNRHFRLLGSTKLDKNTPLVISKGNKYIPRSQDSCHMFLDSLITYFPCDAKRVIECKGEESNKHERQAVVRGSKSVEEGPEPVYPVIDKFILTLISPLGGIRRKLFFSSTSRIIYDIYGYRYCENIQRHHKSNNIMFVVDLASLSYYQKCHDPDCSNFKSQIRDLPDDVRFHLENDEELLHVDVEGESHAEDDIDGDLCEIASCVEDLIATGEM